MDNNLKVGQQSLMGYLPAIVIKGILDGQVDPSKKLPAYHTMTTVSLFADISGFTKLSEVFAKKGRIGPEFLAFSLNRYMEQLINIIGKNGGDIFKFAGDALIVIWPENKNNLGDSCRRAIQCAMDIQSKLNRLEMTPGMYLSVKIGIGCGECSVLFVGGQFNRCEYLIVGEALRQACESETKAYEGGQTICSEPVFELVKSYYKCEEARGNDDSHGHNTKSNMKFYKILKLLWERVPIKADSFLIRRGFGSEKLKEKLSLLKKFVPAAISIYLDIEQESWSKEIRMLTVMFMNLTMDLSHTKTKEGLHRIQEIVHCVQRCIYRTKGSLNKFLMDDKGSVMLVCWGLPPLSAPDDPTRAVLTALDLVKELQQFNCGAYFGIATGTSFTGVCGGIGGRREYSVLGEMVNLAARYMQQAIYYAYEQSKESKSKVDYVILVDEKTRDLIQNKIPCDFCVEGQLKGFSNIFYFYKPSLDAKPDIDSFSIFLPDIKTHKDNILITKPNPIERSTPDFQLRSALYMAGRKELIQECLNYLYKVYKNKNNELIIIRGHYGSGKSLFLRKVMYEFVEHNRELKSKLKQKYPFIFISYQMPTTLFNPMNGWNNILKEIYHHVKSYITTIKPVKIKFGDEVIHINCDIIGELLFTSDCITYVKFIEEILETPLSNHFELPYENHLFHKYYKIRDIPERDSFFETRKYGGFETNICKFFCLLIKLYRDSFIQELPLIFILEEAHLIDEISITLIKSLTDSLLSKENKITQKGICIIVTYQDSINSIVKNPFDKFYKLNDFLINEKTLIMESITDTSMAQEIILYNIEKRVNVNKISEKLIYIILTKSLKGNPLFMIEIINSLIDNDLVEVSQQELLPTNQLLNMFELNDWSEFKIPTRMESLIGNIIDSLSAKEIILLKYASVIGNIFDIAKLNNLNPFNTITFDDLYDILQNLEYYCIIEILHDLNPKHLVCKFNIPFFREVLFQRTLIEQRTDIHLNVARNMQYNKISYMPHNQEVAILTNHLRITEQTFLKQMNCKDEVIKETKRLLEDIRSNLCNNNIKIILVKEICEKLKLIAQRMNIDELGLGKKSYHKIKSGYLSKRADSYISWEDRFILITNTKLFYWYHENDYLENKMPLANFELKHLYSVDLLRDQSKGGKNNLFRIQVSRWHKKNKLKQKSREYYFSCNSRNDLYSWVITLNFLRVKAMYNEFTANFGVINLPLIHEIKRRQKRKIKTKFHPRKNRHNYMGISGLQIINKYLRQSILTCKSNDSPNINMKSYFSDLRKKNSLPIEDPDETENTELLDKVKNFVSTSFNYGFASFLGYIQDIVFGIDNAGITDEKILTIPYHLIEFKSLPVSNFYFQNTEAEELLRSSKGTFSKNSENINGQNLENYTIEEGENEEGSNNEVSINDISNDVENDDKNIMSEDSEIEIVPTTKPSNISFKNINSNGISNNGELLTVNDISSNSFRHGHNYIHTNHNEYTPREKFKHLVTDGEDHLGEPFSTVTNQNSQITRIIDKNKVEFNNKSEWK